MKKSVLAALLVTLGASALATDFYVVVPLKGRHGIADNIQVALATATLPAGIAGQPYAGFNFNSLLQVTGDPSFSLSGVQWAVVAGALPAGLTLGADGTLSGTPTAAGTASFQVSATYKTRNGSQTYQVVVTAITVTLGGAAPPAAMVGTPYSFSLPDHLQVQGDPAFDSSTVTWSITGGALPAGLTLQGNGVVAGTPTAVSNAAFTAQALYKGQPASQAYTIQTASRPARLDASRLVGWATPLTLAQTNSALDATGLVWTVNARPAGHTGQSLGIFANVVSVPNDAYVEVVSSTNAAWILIESDDGTSNGIALDGPGCNRNSAYVASCTSNTAGGWGNSRIGVRYEKSAARVTFYRNGAQVYQQTGVTNPLQRLRLQDRDSPVNSNARTYTVYNTAAGWKFAPAGVQPFGMD